MKVNSFWTARPDDVEVNNGVSETIPDQSLSVRDILMRFTRGSITLPPIETGDDDDIDSDIDVTDMIEAQDAVMYGREVLERVRETRAKEVTSDQSTTESSAPLSESSAGE